MFGHEWVLWVLAVASAVHVVEEQSTPSSSTWLPSIAERRPNPGLGAFLMASAIGFLGLKKRFAYPDSA